MKSMETMSVYLISSLIFSLICLGTCIPKNQVSENEDCGLDGYEAHCVLDIMEEHIEATAIVNHCHIPLDITFRVVYRYGNGTEQRWQYTFVTTNQNERVLIPGLALPPAPNALVFLYVRVPAPLFDLHNTSLAAVEASFVAVVSETQWEEAKFLDEAVTVTSTEDCYSHFRNKDPLIWIIGGTFLGLLLIAAATTAALWWCRRKKIAMDELALVSSLETGLPGAQPYQIETMEQRLDNNNVSREMSKDKAREEHGQNTTKEFSSIIPAFKFGRLKEESPEEVKEKISKTLNKAVVIGNPVLVDKTSVMQTSFNRMAPVSPPEPVKQHLESVGDAFENVYSVQEEKNGPQNISSTIEPIPKLPEEVLSAQRDADRKEEMQGWKQHPLEFDYDASDTNSKSGARPKGKMMNGEQSSPSTSSDISQRNSVKESP